VNIFIFWFSDYFVIKTQTKCHFITTLVLFWSFALPFTGYDVYFSIRAEELKIYFPASILYVDTGFNAFFLLYFGLRVSVLHGKVELKMNYIWKRFTCVDSRCSVV